jgi:hypothetical protein
VNHAEPKFFLQAVDKMKVRVREANSRRLEFVVLHNPSFLQPCHCPDAMRQPRDSWLVSRRYRLAKNFSDDYEPFRRFVCSMLGMRPELQIIGQLSGPGDVSPY